MTQRHQQKAEQIVSEFIASLDEETRKRITTGQLDNLTLIISKALGDEVALAVEQLEEVARRLRSEVEKPELAI